MLSVSPNCIVRSSLEDMLLALQQRDESEKPCDVPPALPRRAVSRSRPPTAKRRLPVTFGADETMESSKFCAKNGEMRGRNKIVALDDFKEQLLQATPQEQKGFHDDDHRQNLHEFDVVVTFQSYVRGEIARKEYNALLRSKKEDTLDHPETLHPELQNRVSMVEATLELKDKEAAPSTEQEEQYEADMTIDLAAAEKSAVAESSSIIGQDGSQLPHFVGENDEGVAEFEVRKESCEDESRAVAKVKKSSQYASSPMEKLRKLKRAVKTWIKDHKVRLRDSKVRVHTVGDCEAVDSHWKTWWGKKSKRSA